MRVADIALPRRILFFFQFGVDQRTQLLRINRSWINRAIVEEKSGRIGHPQRSRLALIGRDTRFDLLAVDVSFEPAKIQTNHAGVSLEQSARVLRFTPDRLLLIKQIVHFPEAILQTGRFGCARGVLGMEVTGKGQMMKNHAHLLLVILLQLLDLRSNSPARRTLKIAEFLQRY